MRASRSDLATAAGVLVTLAVVGCDPAAKTTIHVSQSAVSGVHGTVRVAIASPDAVIAIVREVADRHGLYCGSDPQPPSLFFCARRWESNEDDHARSIYVSVQDQGRGAIDVVVFEWLVFHHTKLGREVLSDIEARLKETFGSYAVSHA